MQLEWCLLVVTIFFSPEIVQSRRSEAVGQNTFDKGEPSKEPLAENPKPNLQSGPESTSAGAVSGLLPDVYGAKRNRGAGQDADGEVSACLGVCTCSDGVANCVGLNLDAFPTPEFPEEATWIHTIDLSENQLKEIRTQDLIPFPKLESLIIKRNKLKAFPKFSKKWPRIRNLQLGGNEIGVVDVVALKTLGTHLVHLGLERNDIDNLTQAGMFKHNTQLITLNLAYNRIADIHKDAFQGLSKLEILEVNDNRLARIPAALQHLENLQKLTLAKNKISNIPEGVLSNLKNLEQFEIYGNPLHSYHQNAFVNLPNLTKLQILASPREEHLFPNLTGTNRLELIHLDRARLPSLPANLCQLAPKLKTLRVRGNRIKELPDFTQCISLKQIDLGGNEIESLESSPFKTLESLQDLLLDNNKLNVIPSESFVGLKRLHTLNLESNNISHIDDDAFMPLNSIKDLNLGQNRFHRLPEEGLKTLEELKAHNNPNLKEFPGAQMFPNIRLVRPSYAYHCCQFLPSTYEHQIPEFADFSDLTEQVYSPEEFDFSGHNFTNLVWTSTGNSSTDLDQDLSIDLWENFVSGMGYPELPTYDEGSISYYKPPDGIDCYPAPGPFLPCNDLFDWWSLRCGVWIVFLLALLGNGCVVFVLVLSRGKMDVPRFLVANLAAADFFMGLYLGFLAVLDASTLGEFRKYAISWQLSPACQIAGFFGVLSSELSVFTLAVITLERNYAITHAMHLNKRLSLKHAAYIMIGAWTLSMLLAAMPLFGISDYRKFAICLPFETEGALSLGYVIFLMLINGVAFSILMGCYLKMYCAIRGSQAWNTNDSKIAKRMALLVFTDFLCWFPIAFFAITAASGLQLISLEGAKVFTVFILPLNSCCNPFLYAILTKQFKKDCVMICKAIEESRVTRGIGRCRHSSNFSNRQTPANTNNSLNSGGGSNSGHLYFKTGNNNAPGVGAAAGGAVAAAGHPGSQCSCNVKCKPRGGMVAINGANGAKAHPAGNTGRGLGRWIPGYKRFKTWFLNGLKEADLIDSNNSQMQWNCQIAEIQQKQHQKSKRHLSSVSSDNFSSSRSDSWRHGAHCMPLRFGDHPRRRNSWTVTRKPSQDSNLSSSRNDSAGTNSTQSTNTWRVSRSSFSSDMSNSLVRAGSGYSDRSGAGGDNSKFSALKQAIHRSHLQNAAASLSRQNADGSGMGVAVGGKPRLIRQVAIQDGEHSHHDGGHHQPLAAQGSVSSTTSGKSVKFKEPGNLFVRPGHTDPCPVHHHGMHHHHQQDGAGASNYARFRTLYAKLTETSREEEDEQEANGALPPSVSIPEVEDEEDSRQHDFDNSCEDSEAGTGPGGLVPGPQPHILLRHAVTTHNGQQGAGGARTTLLPLSLTSSNAACIPPGNRRLADLSPMGASRAGAGSAAPSHRVVVTAADISAPPTKPPQSPPIPSPGVAATGLFAASAATVIAAPLSSSEVGGATAREGHASPVTSSSPPLSAVNQTSPGEENRDLNKLGVDGDVSRPGVELRPYKKPSSSAQLPAILERKKRMSHGQSMLSPVSADSKLASGDPGMMHCASLSNLSSIAEPKYGPHKCTSENALLALQSKYGYSFQTANEVTAAGESSAAGNQSPTESPPSTVPMRGQVRTSEEAKRLMTSRGQAVANSGLPGATNRASWSPQEQASTVMAASTSRSSHGASGGSQPNLLTLPDEGSSPPPNWNSRPHRSVSSSVGDNKDDKIVADPTRDVTIDRVQISAGQSNNVVGSNLLASACDNAATGAGGLCRLVPGSASPEHHHDIVIDDDDVDDDDDDQDDGCFSSDADSVLSSKSSDDEDDDNDVEKDDIVVTAGRGDSQDDIRFADDEDDNGDAPTLASRPSAGKSLRGHDMDDSDGEGGPGEGDSFLPKC